jgi:50S ribosomal protein L16 3-hydroxylase
MQVDPVRLPDRDWTVLVQEVDRHMPAVADLWDQHFSFVPSWRRDDVMVTFYDYDYM